MKIISIVLLTIFSYFATSAQVTYPYPSHHHQLYLQGKPVKMSYMDVSPSSGKSEKTIVLFHGKNFNGYYWKDVVPFFVEKGYRVIVPDQPGWGKSDHPDLQYSFQLLASSTKELLDSLGINKTVILGHSMGGMLATRFALMYPEFTEKLILENPIGLEDYKTFVPFRSFDSLYANEKRATYDSYLKYQKSYYPVWKPEYEQYAKAQAADLLAPNFDTIARANALTYLMILEQPVSYEFSLLKMPTLLIIGQEDRTIVGKASLSEEMKKKHGQYQLLGPAVKKQIPNAKLVKIKGVGHIPHIQDLEAFKKAINSFL